MPVIFAGAVLNIPMFISAMLAEKFALFKWISESMVPTGAFHWDMLMERRTVEDLEAVLAERLEVIRERRSSERRDDIGTRGTHTERRSA